MASYGVGIWLSSGVDRSVDALARGAKSMIDFRFSG